MYNSDSMSAALLEAVLQNPDADQPRLEYADWCAEQEDEATRARAEFIRGQVEIARTDLAVLNQGWKAGLQNRVTALWQRYGAEWAGPLRNLVDSYSFQRGFIGLVKTSAANFLANYQSIYGAAPVQHVDLHGVRDVKENLYSTRGLLKLRSLSMDDCGLYDFHVRLLAASPRVTGLRWLSVADNNLELGAAEAIAESAYLKELRFAEFRGNPVDPGEQLGWDAGVVVSAWLPPEGEALEQRYGYLPWLHKDENVSRFG